LAEHISIGKARSYPILHDVQKAFGHVSEDAMREIASALNLTRAEVYGVVSFYHDFRKEAESPARFKIVPGRSLQSARRRGTWFLSTDNQSPCESGGDVYCLGLCAVGPSAMVGDEVYARLDGAKFRNDLVRGWPWHDRPDIR
jgi:formate dehydrogenase subunit gamma